MIYLFLAIFAIGYSANKLFNKPKPRTMDTQLRELIDAETTKKGIGHDIKQYLLSVIDDDKNDREKYSDDQLARAQHLIDRAGPNALFFMADIAAQLAVLAAAEINGIKTSVDLALGDSATPEQIVNNIVKN